MRFPTATWPQVRQKVAAHLHAIAHAKRRSFVAFLLLIGGAVANVYIPRLFGRVVDAVVSDDGELRGLAWIGVELVLVAIASAVLSAGGFYLLSRLTERVIANLREETVGTALGLPVHRVEEAGSGDLVSRSTDDVSELSAAVTETVPVLTSSIFAIVTTAVALISLDWQYLLVVACAGPIYFVAARNYLRHAPQRYANERASMAERARRVLETIHGRATVRAYAMEQRMRSGISQASRAVVENGYSARRTMMVLQLWITAVELVMLGVGLFVGFWVTSSGAMTVGAVTAAMLMLIRLRGPLMGLMRVLDTVQSGYASLARIVGVTVNPPLPIPPAGAPQPRGDVSMRGVSFSYDRSYDSSYDSEENTDAWAVEDLDLHIAPGQTVALVGASGAGKTTVAALAAGLRVPSAGSVQVDGIEVSRLSDAERVARLALVSQEVYVFSGTLRDDLSLARPNATDEEMWAALRGVQADWADTFADGLDTVVGARGIQLEPVAAQQLALARILLLDPAVVVMDEATAEAGSVGAGALEAAADAVTDGRTALIVAHRLDQASQADCILVMESGRVIERGTHNELLDSKGRYWQLWNAWQKGRD